MLREGLTKDSHIENLDLDPSESARAARALDGFNSFLTGLEAGQLQGSSRTEAPARPHWGS